MESCTQLWETERPQSSLLFEPSKPVTRSPTYWRKLFPLSNTFVAVGPRWLAAMPGWFSCMLLKPWTDLNMSVRACQQRWCTRSFWSKSWSDICVSCTSLCALSRPSCTPWGQCSSQSSKTAICVAVGFNLNSNVKLNTCFSSLAE